MKYFFLIAVIILVSINLHAQKQGPLTLNLYGGYTFKDKIYLDAFHGYVNEAFQYGGGLEYYIQRNRSIELKYLRMDTRFPIYGPAGTKLNEGTDKGSLNYILIGGNNYFPMSSESKAEPYAGFDLGVGIADLKEGGSSTNFAWDAKLGVKINTSDAVSIKLQAYIQSVISAVGSDYYAYPGGAVISIPDYTSIFQFGLGAAIAFNFKSQK